jgi:hypothetical protein
MELPHRVPAKEAPTLFVAWAGGPKPFPIAPLFHLLIALHRYDLPAIEALEGRKLRMAAELRDDASNFHLCAAVWARTGAGSMIR